jgi:hypothetical protein
MPAAAILRPPGWWSSLQIYTPVRKKNERNRYQYERKIGRKIYQQRKEGRKKFIPVK